VISYTNIDFIGGEPVENQWVGSAGISHKLSDQLSVNLTYQYAATVSKQPGVNTTRNYVTVSATYNF
jgi:opacity protein-like surface antigen